ncbi:M56 family metallopeptidase [Maricaulaceae bacterium NA33B04]|nr:M56 family metallopeptidase [Maricaulaceae bacterium NA33B04]
MTGAELVIALTAGLSVFACSVFFLTCISAWLVSRLQSVLPALRARLVLLAALAPYVIASFAALGVIFFPHASPLNSAYVHKHDIFVLWTDQGTLSGFGIITCLASLLTLLLTLRVIQVAVTNYLDIRQLSRTMRVIGSPVAPGLQLIASKHPTAMALGLFRPQIFISQAIKSQLGVDSYDIVEAHERAHIARCDLLTRYMTKVLCSLYPFSLASILHRALVLAQEQACDALVAQAHPPVKIAETLVLIERSRQATLIGAAAFQGADIALRVRALLEPRFEPSQRSAARAGLITAGLILSVFVALEPLHHTIEAFLFLIGG